jgi:hypothetical protein
LPFARLRVLREAINVTDYVIIIAEIAVSRVNVSQLKATMFINGSSPYKGLK